MVIFYRPVKSGRNVALIKVISADFSVPMDPLTITTSTLYINGWGNTGFRRRKYAGTTATFTPGSALILGKPIRRQLPPELRMYKA